MQLSVPTMLVTTLVSARLVGVVLPFARRQREASGIREATISALCFAGSCTLILLKDKIGDAARIVPSNALMWLGFSLQWLAYRRFDAPSGSSRGPLVATFLGVAAFTVLWASGGDYRERSFFASAMVASLAAANAYELVRDGGLRRERSRMIGMAMAMVAVVCQLVRVPLLVALPDGNGALLSGSLEQSVAFFPAMVHVLGVGLGFLVMHVERTERQAREAAMTDPLTGCMNRRAFTVQVEEALAGGAHGREAVALLLLDMDRFKRVNDTYGHAVGDDVIRRVAEVLRDGVRTSDVVARLGGEEFCVLLRGTDRTGAEGLATRLGHALREHPVHTDDVSVTVSASFGVTVAEPGEGWGALFARADRALYAAKAAGRDRVVVA